MPQIQAMPGEAVYRLTERVIAECKRTKQEHEMLHNGVEVKVYPGSHEYDVLEKWELKKRILNASNQWGVKF